MDNSFLDAGFQDPLVGAEIFKLLDVGEATFKDAQEFMKLKEIGEFLGNFQDAPFVVDRALRRNPGGKVKALDAVLSFVKLRKDYMGTQDKLKTLEKELSFYE